MNWLGQLDTFLFDLDGTLTVPVIDFPALRLALGIEIGQSILHALDSLPVQERTAKEAVVREAELEAAHKTVPNEGALELVRWLQAQGHATGVITRNHDRAARITLELLGLEFPVLLTRENVQRVKPAPDPVLQALHLLGRSAQAALMTGDWHDDITSGRAAGAATCLVTNGRELAETNADLVVHSPAHLLETLRAHC